MLTALFYFHLRLQIHSINVLTTEYIEDSPFHNLICASCRRTRWQLYMNVTAQSGGRVTQVVAEV